jgi:hypothetical protein
MPEDGWEEIWPRLFFTEIEIRVADASGFDVDQNFILT